MIVARDYEGFRALLNNRRMELHFSMLELDHLAGLASGYSAKLLSEPRKKCDYQKNIGPDSMGKLLAALGVEISVTPMSASSRIIGGERRSYPQVIELTKKGQKGGFVRAKNLSGRRRREIAQIAGIASGLKRRSLAVGK